MIVNVSYKNFRGHNGSCDVGLITRITGKNRTGKTNLREVICFGFMGTDSAGNRAPVHLITDGQDKLEVLITTEKAVISRTLNRKSKSGTLKLRKGELDTPVTQSQMESMVAPRDVFLSVFVPGFFLSSAMTPARRHAVLRELLPKVNRMELLEDCLGGPITPNEELAVRDRLDGRADLAAQVFTSNRRQWEKDLARNEGSLRELRGLAPVPAKPEQPFDTHFRNARSENKKLWASYRQRLAAWQERKHQADRVLEENGRIGEQRKDLEAELNGMVEGALPEIPDRTKEIAGLVAALKPLPPEPSFQGLPGSPACPTCGQTVGKKHTERVAAQNQKLKEDYYAKAQEINDHNAGVEKKHDDLTEVIRLEKEKLRKAEEHNRRIRHQRQTIEARLSALNPRDLPVVGDEPVPPTEAQISEEENQRFEEESQKYTRALAVYEEAVRQHESAGERVGQLEQQNTSLRSGIERCRQLESCILALPQKELELQREYLEMTYYRITVDDDVRFTAEDGRPLGMMSQGESMKACNALSLKLNSLMARPLNMMFVDNAESIDDPQEEALSAGRRQVFLASVDPSCEELKIHV